jgi:hypothetical protein
VHTLGRLSAECGGADGDRVKDDRFFVDVRSFAGNQHTGSVFDSPVTRDELSYPSTLHGLSTYPKLISKPEMTLLRSPTSCSAEAMIGDPPMASVALAESFATTMFVICVDMNEVQLRTR